MTITLKGIERKQINKITIIVLKNKVKNCFSNEWKYLIKSIFKKIRIFVL